MKRLRNDDGQALAEFALVAPLLIGLMLAIFHFGAALNVVQGLNSAAREGARVEAVGGDGCNAANTVLANVPGSNESCAVQASCPGNSARVSTSATYQIDIPVFGSWNLNLTGNGEFRCED